MNLATYRDEEGRRYRLDDNNRPVYESNDHDARATRVARGHADEGTGDPLGEVLKLQLRTTAQLEAMPRLPYLIDGLSTTESLEVTFGMKGRGKTFVALSQVLSIATGLPWCGRATTKHKVLYVVAEGVRGIGKRTAAWRAEAGVEDVTEVAWLGRSVNLLDSKWAAGLADVVKDEQFEVVVFDTFSRCLVGGDENAAKDMTRAVDNCDLFRSAGAAVKLIHHTTKDGSTVRGHSVLEGAADTMIEVRRDGTQITLRCEKQKDDEPFREIVLNLRPSGDSCVLDSLPTGTGSNTDAEVSLLAAARQFAGSDGLPPSTLIKVSGMAERSFYNARKTLLSRGLLVNLGTDNRPRYIAASEVAE